MFNNKAWVTHGLFTGWINEVSGPSMKKIFPINLPFHVSLVVDNISVSLKNSGFSFCLPTSLHYSSLWIRRLFLSLRSFTVKHYSIFECYFEVTKGINFTPKEF